MFDILKANDCVDDCSVCNVTRGVGVGGGGSSFAASAQLLSHCRSKIARNRSLKMVAVGKLARCDLASTEEDPHCYFYKEFTHKLIKKHHQNVMVNLKWRNMHNSFPIKTLKNKPP